LTVISGHLVVIKPYPVVSKMSLFAKSFPADQPQGIVKSVT